MLMACDSPEALWNFKTADPRYGVYF